MKNRIILKMSILPCLLLAGIACKTTDGSSEEAQVSSSTMIMLQIDYQDHSFKGGQKISLQQGLSNGASLPIEIDYDSPGDFGNLALYYQPTQELLFDGSIIWAGRGERKFPDSMLAPSTFDTLSIPVAMPDTARFQRVFSHYSSYKFPYDQLWSVINHLSVAQEALAHGKNIGVVLYTPAVGLGDPTTFDWYIFMQVP